MNSADDPDAFPRVILETIPVDRRNDMAFGMLCAFEQVGALYGEYAFPESAEVERVMTEFGETLLDYARIAREIYDASPSRD